ncbi:sigma-70 domain-containing protein [Nonomuraea sp. NPDC048901]|uniref:sigma-70 domain-containing protein n=1 Tax=Nonomuraea sp. NPDC048901 TaxID=3155627 RepID=UPI0034048976
MPSGGSARPSDEGWSRPPRCGCRSDADRLAKVARAEMKITHRLGRTPTERELAEETGHEPAKLLTSLIDGLAPWQALIMRLRFGLDGYAPHTPRQIAGQMGLTPYWVRQLNKESVSR